MQISHTSCGKAWREMTVQWRMWRGGSHILSHFVRPTVFLMEKSHLESTSQAVPMTMQMMRWRCKSGQPLGLPNYYPNCQNGRLLWFPKLRQLKLVIGTSAHRPPRGAVVDRLCQLSRLRPVLRVHSPLRWLLPSRVMHHYWNRVYWRELEHRTWLRLFLWIVERPGHKKIK